MSMRAFAQSLSFIKRYDHLYGKRHPHYRALQKLMFQPGYAERGFARQTHHGR
jgi:hypothetical protein